jgi:hypothetical protein
LHLKIEAWNPDPGKLTMDSLKTIIIPRQHVLKTLDPDYTKPLDKLRTKLARTKDEYMDLLDNEHDPEYWAKAETDTRHFTTWHVTIHRARFLGPAPAPAATGSPGLCIVHFYLVHVPKDYIAAELSLRKKTQKLRGAAGPKRTHLLAERRKETVKKQSKLQYMDMEGSGGSSSESIAIKDLIITEVTMWYV